MDKLRAQLVELVTPLENKLQSFYAFNTFLRYVWGAFAAGAALVTGLIFVWLAHQLGVLNTEVGHVIAGLLFIGVLMAVWHFVSRTLYNKHLATRWGQQPEFDTLFENFNRCYPPGSEIRKAILYLINVDMAQEGLVTTNIGEHFLTLGHLRYEFLDEWRTQALGSASTPIVLDKPPKGIANELTRLQELRKSGTLTEEEFQRVKGVILSTYGDP